ncbi:MULTISPECIES: hypothetical protein [Streptomyces]|uniref:hypothetical protein n=1 Tax=Streptomyces TaxID=1883 RepID=UPI00073DFA95|nr:hypothetical protein [Streptomyces sp. SID7810]CUW29773.1 hypothetical protein TUE45_04484 [Streptomyces reticuli]
MGMKDQFQDKSRQAKEQAKEKVGQAREKAGQRGQQGRQGQQPAERGRPNYRDIEDTEQEMGDRVNRDYEA